VAWSDWRGIIIPAYGPTTLVAIGQGAILPLVALSARDLGAGVGTAAFIVALIGVGNLLGDLPAGALAARIGEKQALVAKQEGLGRPACTRAALIPIRKNAAWWALTHRRRERFMPVATPVLIASDLMFRAPIPLASYSLGPLWVISGHERASQGRPLHSRQRTC